MDTGTCPYCGVILEIGPTDYGQGRCGSCGNKIFVKSDIKPNLRVSWNKIIRREIECVANQIEELLVLVEGGLSQGSVDSELNRLAQKKTKLKTLLPTPYN